MAWTDSLDVAVTGEVAPAAMWNELKDNVLSIGPNFRARKTADQGVSSTTYADVTGFSFAIAASEVWIVLIQMDADINGTSKMKMQWSVPSGATGQQRYNGGAASDSTQTIGGDLITGNTGSGVFTITYAATIVNSTNAGTAQFRFGLFTGSNTATIKVNTSMLAFRVG